MKRNFQSILGKRCAPAAKFIPSKFLKEGIMQSWWVQIHDEKNKQTKNFFFSKILSSTHMETCKLWIILLKDYGKLAAFRLFLSDEKA